MCVCLVCEKKLEDLRKPTQGQKKCVKSKYAGMTFSQTQSLFFFYANDSFITCRQYRQARKEQDKRLGVPAKIRCIKEPSRRKAWGSSRSLHHKKTIQGQTLVQVAICLRIPINVKYKSEAHHLTIRAPDWENVTTAALKCFFYSLFLTEPSTKSYILKSLCDVT